MIVKMRPVTVRTIPEEATVHETKKFLRELRAHGEIQRPRMVLDCSNLQRVDRAMIDLILSCLQEAMKLNGNVKRAPLPPLAQATSQSEGIDRLFEIYPSALEAERSYQGLRSEQAPRGLRSENSEDGSGDPMSLRTAVAGS